MPSEKALKKKKEQVKQLSSEIQQTLVGILADYKGINVEQDTKLRRDLRESGVSYRVLKNNIIRRALNDAGISGCEDVLTGSTVLALSNSSYSDGARILCNFAKKNDFYKIKAGFIDGKVVDVSKIEEISKLPSKEQLIAQVLRGLNSPITGFAYVLNGLLRSLVIALSEISKQKS